MSVLKKLASQTAIYGISTIIGRFLNYLLVPLYTYQFVNQSEYGIVSEFYVYISFLNILFLYGMETAFFNFSSKEPNKDLVYGTALSSILGSTVILSLPLLLFAGSIAAALGYPGYSEYIWWVVVILATDALSAIPFARLREQNKAKKFAAIKMVNILVNVGINLFFLWFCKNQHDISVSAGFSPGTWGSLYNPEIGIGYIFIANAAANVFTTLLLLPEFFRTPLRFDAALWKRMIIYALPLLVFGFAGMINETLDRILIKHFDTSADPMAQVGIYSACYKIAILMTIFIQAFRYAAEPFFFAQAKEKDPAAAYALTMKWFVIACSFIFLGTMMNLSWIQYFIGEGYRSGLDIVPILLIANLFLGIYYNLSIWYKVTGKTQYGAYITLAGAVITLGLNIALIPAYGYMASAWTTLACYSCMMLLSWAIGNKHYPVDYPLKPILGYLALSVALYLISVYMPFEGSMSLVVNNLLLIAFAVFTYVCERPGLKLKS